MFDAVVSGCCPLAAILHTNEKQTHAGGEDTGHQCPLWTEELEMALLGADTTVAHSEPAYRIAPFLWVISIPILPQ